MGSLRGNINPTMRSSTVIFWDGVVNDSPIILPEPSPDGEGYSVDPPHFYNAVLAKGSTFYMSSTNYIYWGARRSEKTLGIRFFF